MLKANPGDYIYVKTYRHDVHDALYRVISVRDVREKKVKIATLLGQRMPRSEFLLVVEDVYREQVKSFYHDFIEGHKAGWMTRFWQWILYNCGCIKD